jgi:hypothetical protein
MPHLLRRNHPESGREECDPLLGDRAAATLEQQQRRAVPVDLVVHIDPVVEGKGNCYEVSLLARVIRASHGAGAESGAVQKPQNANPSGFSLPHAGQTVIPASLRSHGPLAGSTKARRSLTDTVDR